MYVKHSTGSPYSGVSGYVTPYPFPLPANPGLGHCCDARSMAGMGQSATAHRRGMRVIRSGARAGLRGYRSGYDFTLPSRNMQGLGEMGALTAKSIGGAALLAAAGWFVYKHALKK